MKTCKEGFVYCDRSTGNNLHYPLNPAILNIKGVSIGRKEAHKQNQGQNEILRYWEYTICLIVIYYFPTSI